MDCCNHNLTTKKEDNKLYQCPECGLWYNDKEWAEKCEAWCKERKSCNLEITSHSVVPNKMD
ncbi:MAG: hypothetical protein UT37_C0011G0011 [Parcubacteria group bacterium GW2011_GWA2_39_18]|nr:MAG: hypothetical protein UT37_C0011G0011 [Parcubacteria group bacterium GW2011_GWA2_39_18]